MKYGKRVFRDEEVEYLNTLPAVRHASPTRITYEDAFKLECLARDRKGESPTRVFREYGLAPEVLGPKRIERCMSRWRSDPSLQDALNKDGETNPMLSDDNEDRRERLIREQAMHIVTLENEVRRLRAIIKRERRVK
ncbi:hypothetical protein [Bifidobacterium felsineum]|uniref:Uncharacterized protein n=1 Tax=Bifidobacterium felsineum TaxID=2045440 RepID=A0A2M9HLD6_9BIFI|nr:hypothetical protein [Bifidobacterium felsineum]MBT1163155.1 hypothetical protein [Bifidobacterium felsineum]PJM77635.1 hypothetical protein CSQ86_00670 [Bifidobacterium felsineum]